MTKFTREQSRQIDHAVKGDSHRKTLKINESHHLHLVSVASSSIVAYSE